MVIRPVPMTGRGAMVVPVVLTANIAVSGNVSAVDQVERAYEVGRAIRTRVQDDTAYVSGAAMMGGWIGSEVTHGRLWGAGVGFVGGWIGAEFQLRRWRR
jgi:hypothetical protein